ncbi:MAG: HDIG domain-containing protein [Synergistaceae bacterium]|jgi:putative nucleotidyltransferase with HDIG domain|nr:HDIG domain-containing protein [Synergistaceae bacterium]
MKFTRDESIEFFKEHNKDDMHFRHALAVEAAMKYFARHYGEDEELWGRVGLLHDIDWEITKSVEAGHPVKGGEMLREAGYDEEFVRAVLAHGWDFSGVEPITKMEKTLFTADELTGFVTAVALVRPSKSLMDLEVKSVRKKWKDKAFAKGVDRTVIERGGKLMGESLDWLIEGVISALRPIEKELGLGSASV